MAMAVSTQLGLWQFPTMGAMEARCRAGGIGFQLGFPSVTRGDFPGLNVRRDLPNAAVQLKFGFKIGLRSGIRDNFRGVKVSRDSPSAAEKLELAEEGSANADGETKQPQKGLVKTWFYGGYVAWPEVHRLLTERNVKDVEWQEAYDLAQSGAAILLDVRESQDFKKVHAQGAFGAPLFRLIQGNDLKTNLRRLGYALLTDFAGTERNPDFIDQALQAVGGDKQKLVIVICEIGGTLSTFVERKGPKAKKFADPERRFGRPSRSLRAVFELQQAGFKSVSYLTGGIGTWIHQDLPTEGGK